jgi:hypothetical protein
MNKLVRGVITGSLIGAGVGVAMLVMRNRGQKMMMKSRPQSFNERTRGTFRMVKDNAMRWTSAVKNGSEAFSRSLSDRMQ